MAAANEAALAHNGHGSAACLLRMVTATLPLKATATRLLRTQQLSTTPVACTNSTVT